MRATVTVLPFTTVQPSAQRFYRCYLLAETGHIQAVEILSCGSDGDAETLAELIFQRQPGCAAIELWDVGRVMLRLHRDNADRHAHAA